MFTRLSYSNNQSIKFNLKRNAMRKSFTWFLSLMVLLTAFATHGYAQEEQETVELYAEDASHCYNEANDYTVNIAVRDFIKLTKFELGLSFNDEIFTFTGVSDVNTGLAGLTTSVTALPGHDVLNLNWTATPGSPVTIGDDLRTDVITVHFELKGYPANTVNSYSTDLEWTQADFWYTTSGGVYDDVNTVRDFDGSLAVNVEMTGIETTVSTESCAGGDVILTVTAPEAAFYLFNEDPDPDNWTGAWSTSPVYSVQAGDEVTVRIKDADGCMSLKQIVNVPETVEPVSFTVETQDPACYGEKGSVVIHATGGTAPYTYYITDGEDEYKTYSNFQFNYAPGVYYVAVQDANGCADLEDEEYWQQIEIVDENDSIDIVVISEDVLCYGESTGTITVSSVNATMASLDKNTWEALEEGEYTFENLPAGTYTVWVKNDIGCTADTVGVLVDQPEGAIAFDMEIVDTSCGGENDGEIIVTNIVGGTSPYTLDVQEGANVTTETGVEGTGFTFTGLKPTYYSLTITDANGCVVEYDNPNGTGNVIAVQSPEDIKFEVNVTQPLCNNDDATVTVTNITGGTGSYVILFNDVANDEAPFNEFTWGYPYDGLTVTVQNDVDGEDNTCPVSVEAPVVENPDALWADVRDDFPPTCIEGNDGSIRLDIGGGTKPYYYSINGSAWKEAKFTDDLVNIRVGIGVHEILVKDANGCEYPEPIEVEIGMDPNVIEASSEIIKCFGTKEGTISVDFLSWADGLGEDGEPIRGIQWYVENESGQVSSFMPLNGGGTPTKFYAGTYIVWVVDQYTCESNKVTVEVEQNYELLFDDVVANGASCYQTFDGLINIYVKGGTFGGEEMPMLEYAVVNNEGALGNIEEDKWLPFDEVDYPTGLPPYSSVSTHADGGTYWIAVRDECTEKYFGPVEVDGYEQLLVDESKITKTDPLCHDDANGTLTVPMSAVSGGAGSYKFTLFVFEDDEWVAVEEYTEVSNGEFTGLPAGTYMVRVDDEMGCPEYITDGYELENPEELDFEYEYFHFSCYGANDGIISLYPYGGTGNYHYAINNPNVWLPFGAGVDEKTYIATEPGTYTVWIKDDNGCVTEPVEITIEQPEQLDAEITITHVTCPGGSDGWIEVEGSGGWEGVSQYWFKLDDGYWTTGTTFSGLTAGEHILYIGQDDSDYDAPYQWWGEDCIEPIPFEVKEPGLITYDVIVEDVSCKDGADGSLTVNVLSGGTPWDLTGTVNDGYDVKLTGDDYDSGWIRTGADFSHTFSDLPHSHYTVYIQDSRGCVLLPTIGNITAPYTTIESWEVNEPATYLTLLPEWVSDVTCYGGEDGQFLLHAAGGTPPYVYYTALSVPPASGGHYLVPDPEDEGWQESNEFNVGAGTWVTWVMDANGCIVGGEYDVNDIPVNQWRVKIQQPAEITWDFLREGTTQDDIIYEEPSCFGEWDGEIYLDYITGGTSPYGAIVTGIAADGETVNLVYEDIESDEGYYVLDGVPASNDDGFSVKVVDSKGCETASKTIIVEQPAQLTVDLIKSPGSFTCADSNEGWIEANVTGGTGSYSYQLLKNGVVHTTWQSLTNAYLVQIGNEFTVQVKDANGCTAEATIDIQQVEEVVIAEIDDRTCYGDETPKAVVVATAEPGRDLFLRFREVPGEGLFGPWSDWLPFNEGEGDNTHVITDELTFGDVTESEGHFDFQVKDEEGCLSEIEFKTFVPVQHPVFANYEIVELAECSATVEITNITGGIAPYVILVNDEVLGEEEAIVLPRGEQVISIVDAHQCTYLIPLDIEGEYVTRDTIVEKYIGHELEFADEESGVEETFTEEGVYEFVYDFEGCERTLIVTVVEVPRPLTIAEVQGEADESPWVGEIVKVVGTVTGVAEGEGFFMQDDNAPWSGIWVPWADAADYAIGDGVAVVGEVDEISSVTSLVATSVEAVEAPLAVVAIDLDSPSAAKDEKYESVLVKVKGARATAADEGTGEWTIFTEDTDNVVVNDWLYDFTPEAGNFYNVRGIVNTRMEAFKLEPRIEPDIEDLTATAVGPELSTNEFKVYPNPFTNEINIDKHEKLTRVVVSNIAGQRMIDIAFPGKVISTSKLASGVYVVSMFTESGLAKTERIVKR